LAVMLTSIDSESNTHYYLSKEHAVSWKITSLSFNYRAFKSIDWFVWSGRIVFMNGNDSYFEAVIRLIWKAKILSCQNSSKIQ